MTWSVQPINGPTGVIPPPAGQQNAPAVGVPFVWVVATWKQQHFTYRDGTGTIWDSWYDGLGRQWNLQQINLAPVGLTHGPMAVGDPFAGPYFNGQEHIGYLDAAGIICDSWYDPGSNQWELVVINGPKGATPPTLANDPSKNNYPAVGKPFIWVFGNQLHVTYRDRQGFIWDSWHEGGGTWNLQRLNGGSPARTGGVPASSDPFVSVFGLQEHVAYRDQDGIIWDAWYDDQSKGWSLQTINGPNGQTVPYLPSDPTVLNYPAVGQPFVWVYGGQQHFTYRDAVGFIWDSWYDFGSNKWQLQKINRQQSNGDARTPGNYAAEDPFVATFASPSGQSSVGYDLQQHVAYLDSAGYVWDAWYDGHGNWSIQQINTPDPMTGPFGLTPGPKAVAGPFVSAFSSATNQQQHFAYLDASGIVWDSWYNGPLLQVPSPPDGGLGDPQASPWGNIPPPGSGSSPSDGGGPDGSG